MIKWPSDQVNKWPNDQMTNWPNYWMIEWPNEWVTGWQKASQTIDRMVYFFFKSYRQYAIIYTSLWCIVLVLWFSPSAILFVLFLALQGYHQYNDGNFKGNKRQNRTDKLYSKPFWRFFSWRWCIPCTPIHNLGARFSAMTVYISEALTKLNDNVLNLWK